MRLRVKTFLVPDEKSIGGSKKQIREAISLMQGLKLITVPTPRNT